MSSVNVCQKLSSAVKATMNEVKTFAHTQALWRFLHNEQVDLPGLSEPVLEMARAEVPAACEQYVLAVHDWSRLNYKAHIGKPDRTQMSHQHDIGYELQSTVLVSDRDGQPIAVPVQNLVTDQGVWQSRHAPIQRKKSHLDELSERIHTLETQGFGKQLVHLVDREADSVAHLRAWKNTQWIIRAKAGGTVQWNHTRHKISSIAQQLNYSEERDVRYKGRAALQRIAQTEVTLTRPAKPTAIGANGKRRGPVAGEPLIVRLIVSQICNTQGAVLAQWFLLSNVPVTVAAEQIALWYYWRWNIESFFKLLKEAGQQLESWQQKSGLAIAKRLLISSQACAVIWRLLRAQGPSAEALRTFLVRLSGRQMKPSRPVTQTALMDGFFRFLNLMETLQIYSIHELKQFGQSLYPHRSWNFV